MWWSASKRYEFSHPKQKNRAWRGVLALAFGVVVLMLSASPARAQATGATDVDINLPNIVVLHYYSNVDITIGKNELGTFLTGSAGDSGVVEGTSAPASGGFSPDLAMTPSALTGDPSAAVLTLQNAWAVRAISLSGGTDTQLAITNTDNTLTHAGGGTMIITGVAVDDGSSNGATITFASPGLVTPTVGDVELTVDFSGAVEAGDYLDGIYTLTATNI